MRQRLVIGTRGSKLALWQAEHIAERLRQEHAGLEVELKRIVTTGDKVLDVPLAKIGGKGLFTKELEVEMLSGQIDLAVHSLKDMPTELPEGLCLAAITERADAGDALVSRDYASLEALPLGATLGTSSLRRKAQLLRLRPDLKMVDLRGNLDTRLKKVQTGELDAIVLAAAGLKRLGWEQEIAEILKPEICLPAVGQGCLAVEARADDAEVLSLLAFLNHKPSRVAAEAERAFLREVEGGCQVPVGVYAQEEQGQLTVTAVILTLDGKECLKAQKSGCNEDAAELGVALAKQLLAAGGKEILVELMQSEGV